MDRGQSQLSQELQSRIRFLGAQLQPGPLLRERLNEFAIRTDEFDFYHDHTNGVKN